MAVGGRLALTGLELFLQRGSASVRLLLISTLCLRECFSTSTSVQQRRCFWDNTRRATRCVHKDGSSWLSTPSTRTTQKVKQNDRRKAPARARRSGNEIPHISTECLSLHNCTGINFYKNGIMADLEPWLQTGITQQAADLGSSWQVLKTNWSADRTSMCEYLRTLAATRTYLCAYMCCVFDETGVRISIINGKIYASHLGFSHATRDGMFLIILLEMLKLYPDQPDVSFVLLTGDRARVRRSTYTSPSSTIPFAVSFARHEDYFDVSVPDPSFFGWPEMHVAPHWMLTATANAQLQTALTSTYRNLSELEYPLFPSKLSWNARSEKLHWRGGSKGRGHLREAILGCVKQLEQQQSKAQSSPPHAKLSSKFDIAPYTETNWEHPLSMAKDKVALFIQGEGFTSG